MAKQLKALIKERFSTMSYDDKIRFIHSIRKSRSLLKASSRKAKKQKKEARIMKSKFEDLLANMSPEEKLKFLENI